MRKQHNSSHNNNGLLGSPLSPSHPPLSSAHHHHHYHSPAAAVGAAGGGSGGGAAAGVRRGASHRSPTATTTTTRNLILLAAFFAFVTIAHSTRMFGGGPRGDDDGGSGGTLSYYYTEGITDGGGDGSSPSSLSRPFAKRSKWNKGVRLQGIVRGDVVEGTPIPPPPTTATEEITTSITTTAEAAQLTAMAINTAVERAGAAVHDAAVGGHDGFPTAGDAAAGGSGSGGGDAVGGDDDDDSPADAAAGGSDDVLLTPLNTILAQCSAEQQRRGAEGDDGSGGERLADGGADNNNTSTTIINSSRRQCDPRRCRYCQHFPPHGSPSASEDVTPLARAYLAQHVLFAVVTGSFGNFSRLDIAYCTWLQLVPEGNLYLVADVLPTAPTPTTVGTSMGRNGGEGDGRADTFGAAGAAAEESSSDHSSAYTRRGTWLRGAIPKGHTFSKKQLAATGYTIAWHRAQYRFMLGLDAMVRRAVGTAQHSYGGGSGAAEGSLSSSSPSSSVSSSSAFAGGVKGLQWEYAEGDDQGEPYAFPDGDGGGAHLRHHHDHSHNRKKGVEREKEKKEHIKWIVVVDDDTFVNLNALVVYFRRMDKQQQQQGHTSSSAATRGGGEEEEVIGEIPIYIGDKGWGGAGHFFNRAAAYRLQRHLFAKCVGPHMMRGAKASDEALKKCLPHLNDGGTDENHQNKKRGGGKSRSQSIKGGGAADDVAAAVGVSVVSAAGAGDDDTGNINATKMVVGAVSSSSSSSPPRIRVLSDRLFSHCQANFLRNRLLKGDHITSHIKRDVTGPIALQSLRARLYYQVVYRANRTCAYNLLMHFGACAFGSSCKLKRCDEAHDAAALRDYEGLLMLSPSSSMGTSFNRTDRVDAL